MLVLAMVLAIATLAIALLLRFLLALNSEIRTQAAHTRPQRLARGHTLAVREPVNRLVLVHSNPLPLHETQGGLAATLVVTREVSRVQKV